MDDATTDRPGFLRSDTAILISLALFEFVIHVVANAAGSYGYFRDELYYIACSDHLDWGYVDQPPFSIGVLWATRHLLGDSLVALRILPALAGSCVVYLAGVTAKELGGNRFAIVLAACAVITAPILLAMSSFYSMNVFDEVFWSAAAFLMVIIVKRGRLGHWLLLGAILGLGLMNKIGVLWLGAGLGLGLLLTEHRRWLLGRGVWLAAAVALVLFLPHIVWQISHAFPTLEFIRNATGQKYVPVSPLNLFLQQIDAMNVFALPIWITGLLSLGFWKGLKPFRLLAILYVAVFLILVANRAGVSLAALPGPLCGGSGCDRTVQPGRPVALAPPRPADFGDCGRLHQRAVRDYGAAGGDLYRLRPHAGRRAFDSREERNRPSASVLCGHVRLGRPGGDGGSCVQHVESPGAGEVCCFCQQLRGSRGN